MNHGFILGYHGCTQETARRILSGELEHLSRSNSEYEWLGEGVYFWGNSYDRAWEWATKFYPDSPDVIGAIIVPGYCFDLTDSRCSKGLKEFGKIFEKLYQVVEKRNVPKNDLSKESHPYDCALINCFRRVWPILSQNGAQIDTIRAAFSEGEKIAQSSFCELNHIQWAIINPKHSILGYFRPAELAKQTLYAQMRKIEAGVAE